MGKFALGDIPQDFGVVADGMGLHQPIDWSLGRRNQELGESRPGASASTCFLL